jgi:cell division protein FtsI (penicillin-binding protein 3)
MSYHPDLKRRRGLMLAGWLLTGAIVLVRAGQVQLVEGAEWQSLADSQHRMTTDVPAPRGAILDRDGEPLVVSREVYKVAVAPGEVRDREVVRDLLRSTLGLSAAQAERAVDPERAWVVVPGVFEPAVNEALSGIRGVHLSREIRRDRPLGDLALGVLGYVQDGEGRGGIEQAFDSILQGRPGREVVARDRAGNAMPGQVFEVQAPQPGGDVVLTLDVALQEIAQEALSDALDQTGATGGDLLITDPATGEVLALASVRDGRADALSALTTSYEPGSTLKPFTVAGLMRHGRARLDDSLDIGEGHWRVNGRVLHDVHGSGIITLADALRESSNVGVAKAALALTPGEQYEMLRDFGFGLPTGLPLPGEASGILRRPEEWSLQSPQSLAIGYEIAVTPIQMAMAYGALANGGRLMEARLVREVRRPLEEPRTWAPREVRQVVDTVVTRALGSVLVEAVDDGTGTRAHMSTFRVAGKSGTARLYSEAGGYEQGAYFSSFAGFFPADRPQLVVFVKLERPRGAYYGGAVAAPVTRAAMEAALAARGTPLDRTRLAQSMRAPERPAALATVEPELPTARFAVAAADAAQGTSSEPTRAVDALSDDARTLPDDAAAARSLLPEGIPVPDLRGQPVRSAARQLHALGFKVTLEHVGAVESMQPTAGARLPRGSTIHLRAAPPGRGAGGRPER